MTVSKRRATAATFGLQGAGQAHDGGVNTAAGTAIARSAPSAPARAASARTWLEVRLAALDP
ncbi:hypothetical protein [Streptomyces chartreusis]|uniref:hypothetical protein n=1 Tax=Streptomyces chartreusis TaxID=1969 RepID=UPI0036B92889